MTCRAEAPVTGGEPTGVVRSAAYSVGATAGCRAEISRGTASEPALNTDRAVCGSWLADSGTCVVGLPRPPASSPSIAAVALSDGWLAGWGGGDSSGFTAGSWSVTLVTLAV